MQRFVGLIRNRRLLEVVTVSTAYIAAFLVTSFVLYPLQLKAVPEFESYAILVYLPHGVRVLSAWLLGWRSVLALAPGAIIANYYEFDQASWDSNHIMVFLIGIIVAALAFSLFRVVGVNAYAMPDRMPRWQTVMAVGVLASALNAVLTNLVLGTFAIDFLAYLVGDVFGLFSLLLLLILVFRHFRIRG